MSIFHIAVDLTGQVFGRLSVVSRAGTIGKEKRAAWNCRCSCGIESIAIGKNLRSGNTRSCGCLGDENRAELWKRSVKHGLSRMGNRTRAFQMFSSAKCRAKRAGLDFDLDFDDMRIPATCPLLGTPLVHNNARGPIPNSPTLDRIQSSLGYVKGNVWVISHRANTIKNNASLEELERIVAALKKRLSA